MSRSSIDLTEKKFNRWFVIKKIGKDKFGNIIYLCKCDCGIEREVSGYNLIHGKSKSCGCYRNEIARKIGKSGVKDLTGKQFGRLTVLRRSGSSNNGNATWWVRCDCGVEKEVLGCSLIKGATTSCGCYFSECTSERLKIESGLAAKRAAYRNYKNHARQRNITFELSFEQFLYLTQQNCHYCGCKPSNVQKPNGDNGDFIYNGIDRKDNTKGYTIENCVPCNDICNRAKGAMLYKEFIQWIKRLVDNGVWKGDTDANKVG